MNSSPVTSVLIAADRRTYLSDGISTCMNGIMRLTSLSASLVGLTMISELAIRGFSSLLNQVGISPRAESKTGQLSQYIVDCGMRPFADQQKYPTMTLLGKATLATGAALVGNELTTVLAGPPPSIYKLGLNLLSPFDLSSERYYDRANKTFTYIQNLFSISPA